MHRMMHRSHVGDNRVVFADRVAALVTTDPYLNCSSSVQIVTGIFSIIQLIFSPGTGHSLLGYKSKFYDKSSKWNSGTI